MRIDRLSGALVLSLVATASQAQQAMDHSPHAGHAAPGRPRLTGSFGFGVVRLETTAGAVVGRVRGGDILAQQ